MKTIVEMPAGGLAREESSTTAETANVSRQDGPSQLPFALAIFLGAFLLFQVQLLLGKQILPMFGGAPAVWTSCMLVYQLLLLAGYAYAHGLAARTSLRGQTLVQVTIVAASLAALAAQGFVWSTSITPGAGWRPAPDASPLWTIVRFLFAAIGLPFFLLSTASPLLQHWCGKVAPGRSPYRMYALSNTGSLLGLLSYPFLIEPNLRLRTQAWVWVVGYVCFGAAYIFSAVTAKRSSAGRLADAITLHVRPDSKTRELPWTAPVLWVGLAACASVLLLATTNFICQEVAVIPFLWVLPLSLYLFSFIVCFESDRWYQRGVIHASFALAAAGVVLVTLPEAHFSYLVQIGVCSILLFSGCMVCHGEAALRRPRAELLTKFYLCISIGGAIGGVFVSLIAPKIFSGYWELPLGVLACGGLMFLVAHLDRSSWWHTSRPWLAGAILAPIMVLAPGVAGAFGNAPNKVLRGLFWVAAVVLAGVAALLYAAPRQAGSQGSRTWLVRLSSGLGFLAVATGLAVPPVGGFTRVLARTRNFYGALTVSEKQPENYLALSHGRTLHGFQFRDPRLALLPAGYYGVHSGANILLQNWHGHPTRVGLVGLGTGALAALARPGDVYRFYEINPDVLRLATGDRAFFTYVRDSAGRIEVVFGDARLSLENEAARGELQQFDVLVLDAFSSDAIPMHLLTREAFGAYVRHLRGPASVIAAHVSNQTLDLGPVLAGIAREYQFHALRTHPTWMPGFSAQSDWILLSRNAAVLESPELREAAVPYPGSMEPILWTDDYCNLLRVLR